MRARESVTRLHAEALLTALARQYGIEPEAILGRGHRPTEVRARHHFWAVLRHTLALSLHELADAFGVDHTSVLYGVRAHEHLLQGGAS